MKIWFSTKCLIPAAGPVWLIFCTSSNALVAQSPPVILEVETQNSVVYRWDVLDPSKLASSASIVPGVGGVFTHWIFFADVVAINGKPAKGVYAVRATTIAMIPTATAGQSIADVTRSDIADRHLEIQDADGTPVGAIVASGLAGGTAPPGAPTMAFSTNTAVLGGTGAFLGARGQLAHASGGSARQASMAEMPANRRINGGGSVRVILHLIPASWPEILATPMGPAIFHGDDFSQVSEQKPARRGELLIMRAKGLGPTRPGINPGQPFPPYPDGRLHEVNSPVEVKVNESDATVVNKIGWPTEDNIYRVDFVVPQTVQPGMASVGLRVAWIAGNEVKIPVR